MIRARQRLFGQLRAFVEQHLAGVVAWDDVEISESVPSERVKVTKKSPDGRRNPEGPFQEIVAIRFGQYELEARSPNADPPLGWIELRVHGTIKVEGPLDVAIWDQVGSHIKQNGVRKNGHGQGTAGSGSGSATADGWQPAR